ncbi:hypothetical protein, partial [Burkholderia vietnamiensis]|uniref:hypothetical protein n=1 Tax=Burkholderia vietnamiensis TaxID=60552 RepID=UPI001CF45CC7
CTASVLNSAVYACFGILNIILSFLRVEFTHDLLEGEISGEAQSRERMKAHFHRRERTWISM